MSQVTLEGIFTLEVCCNCGIGFAVPDDFHRRRRADHALFYCPSGHGQHYAQKSEAEKLRENLATAKANEAFWIQRSEEKARALVSAEHRLRATRGVVTRIKRRVAHGVCPCCQRTFKDLARHMEGQHPDFGKVSHD